MKIKKLKLSDKQKVKALLADGHKFKSQIVLFSGTIVLNDTCEPVFAD